MSALLFAPQQLQVPKHYQRSAESVGSIMKPTFTQHYHLQFTGQMLPAQQQVCLAGCLIPEPWVVIREAGSERVGAKHQPQ